MGMNDKKAYEAYRVLQFSGPHPALQVATEAVTVTVPPAVQMMPEQLGSGMSASEQPRRVATPAAMSSQVDPLGVQLPADQYRVIVHFDVDAFYSQVSHPT